MWYTLFVVTLDTAPTAVQVWLSCTVHPVHAVESQVSVGSEIVGGAAWGWLGVFVPSMLPLLIVVPAVALLRMWAELLSVIDDVDEVTLWPATVLLDIVTDPLAQTSFV